MPISPIGDCSAAHWQDVKDILHESINSAGYNPRIVSLGEEVSIIHERIVKNLYSDEIVVCDVSCKNANVMFELGLRLAFDKPIIIVKDDVTDYSFDTGPIEHLTYPRSLRFAQINLFKTELTKKITATVKAKNNDPNFSPFLSAFGPLKSAKIDTQEVPSQEIIIDYLNRISSRLDLIESSRNLSSRAIRSISDIAPSTITIVPKKRLNNFLKSKILAYSIDKEGVDDIKFLDSDDGTKLLVDIRPMGARERIEISTEILAIANSGEGD